MEKAATAPRQMACGEITGEKEARQRVWVCESETEQSPSLCQLNKSYTQH